MPIYCNRWLNAEGAGLMIYFELSININRPPHDVFVFLRDKDKHIQGKNSPVLILEKTTEGPAGVGTRYREVVQMLPFYKGEILSQITRFEPPEFLEEDFAGAGMSGHLSYRFVADGEGTTLIQRQSLYFACPLKPFQPLIKAALSPRLTKRLAAIKVYLESNTR